MGLITQIGSVVIVMVAPQSVAVVVLVARGQGLACVLEPKKERKKGKGGC